MLHHTMRDIEPCVGGCTPSSPNGRGGDCAVARDAMNGLGRDGFSLLFAHFGAKKPIKILYGGLLKKCLLNPPYPHLVGAQFYERRVRDGFHAFSGCFVDAVGAIFHTLL